MNNDLVVNIVNKLGTEDNPVRREIGGFILVRLFNRDGSRNQDAEKELQIQINFPDTHSRSLFTVFEITPRSFSVDIANRNVEYVGEALLGVEINKPIKHIEFVEFFVDTLFDEEFEDEEEIDTDPLPKPAIVPELGNLKEEFRELVKDVEALENRTNSLEEQIVDLKVAVRTALRHNAVLVDERISLIENRSFFAWLFGG